MKASKIKLVEELKKKILILPGIVDKLEKRDYSFVIELILWIRDIEDFFQQNNIAEASKISAYRSLILSVKFDEQNRNYKRKQIKVASEVLIEIQNLISNVLDSMEIIVKECRNLVVQILSILSIQNNIKYTENKDFQAFIESIWSTVIKDEKLKAGALRLKYLLSLNDIYLLIAEEIKLEDFC